MLLIMTDDELIKRKKMLMERRDSLQVEEDMDRLKVKEMYAIWRAEKNPKTKRDLHKRIFKMRDKIDRHPRRREMNIIDSEICEIDRMLFPSSSQTLGNLYVSDGELDIERILEYGINGFKL